MSLSWRAVSWPGHIRAKNKHWHKHDVQANWSDLPQVLAAGSKKVVTALNSKCPDLPATSTTSHTVSARNGHSRCVICGDLNPRSWQVVFEKTKDGAVNATFAAHPEFQGYDNQLHGGIMASLLDAAMTHCLFHNGIAAVTGDLRVRFLHPVACHSTILVRAWLFFSCPPLYHLKAEITCKGAVMAWADAKFMRREKQDDR